jgi:hypothetical protein
VAKQITIVLNTQEEYDNTGIIGWVELFGSSHYNIIVRPGVVIVDGAASLNPDKARIFAKALDAAARLAENRYGQDCKLQSNGNEDIT